MLPTFLPLLVLQKLKKEANYLSSFFSFMVITLLIPNVESVAIFRVVSYTIHLLHMSRSSTSQLSRSIHRNVSFSI